MEKTRLKANLLARRDYVIFGGCLLLRLAVLEYFATQLAGECFRFQGDGWVELLPDESPPTMFGLP